MSQQNNTKQKQQLKPKKPITVNSIFPTSVVGKRKPETGRTQSLQYSKIILPDKDKWTNLEKICSETSMTPGDIIIKNNKDATSNIMSSQIQLQSSQKPTVESLTKFVHPIFGIQQPIVSGTGAAYMGNQETNLHDKYELPQKSFGDASDTMSPKFQQQHTLYKIDDFPLGNDYPVGSWQKRQIDLANEVLKVKSPLEYLLQNSPEVMAKLDQTQLFMTNQKPFDPERNCSFNNAVSTEQRGEITEIRNGEVTKLRRGNSSELSKDFPVFNDTLLKPMIHYGKAGQQKAQDLQQKHMVLSDGTTPNSLEIGDVVNNAQKMAKEVEQRSSNMKTLKLGLSDHKQTITTMMMNRTDDNNHSGNLQENGLNNLAKVTLQQMSPKLKTEEEDQMSQNSQELRLGSKANSQNSPRSSNRMAVKNGAIQLHGLATGPTKHQTLDLYSMEKPQASRLPRKHTTLMNVTQQKNSETFVNKFALGLTPAQLASQAQFAPDPDQQNKEPSPKSDLEQEQLTNSKYSQHYPSSPNQRKNANSRQPTVVPITFQQSNSPDERPKNSIAATTIQDQKNNQPQVQKRSSNNYLSQQSRKATYQLKQSQGKLATVHSIGQISQQQTKQQKLLSSTGVGMMLKDHFKPILQEDLLFDFQNHPKVDLKTASSGNKTQRTTKSLGSANSKKPQPKQQQPESLCSEGDRISNKNGNSQANLQLESSSGSYKAASPLLIKPQNYSNIRIEKRNSTLNAISIPTAEIPNKIQQKDTNNQNETAALSKNDSNNNANNNMDNFGHGQKTNNFCLKGTKASISSQNSNIFQQLKQRQMKFDSPSPRNIKEGNLLNLRNQKAQQTRAIAHKSNLRRKWQKTVEQANQTSRAERANSPPPSSSQNQQQSVHTTTLKTHGNGQPSQLGAYHNQQSNAPYNTFSNPIINENNAIPGMINHDSKIVVVQSVKNSSKDINEIAEEDFTNDHSFDSKNQNQLVIGQYKGRRTAQSGAIQRRQIKRDQFISDSQVGDQQNQQLSNRAQLASGLQSQQKVQQQQQADGCVFGQTNRISKTQGRARRTIKQRQGLLIGAEQNNSFQYKTDLIKEINSSTSKLMKPQNMLSQVLGIGSSCSQRYNHQRASGQLSNVNKSNEKFTINSLISPNNKQEITPAAPTTISNEQARQLNIMRGRIKSQGGPRRRYLNQRQNLYNLMANDFKRAPMSSNQSKRYSQETSRDELNQGQAIGQVALSYKTEHNRPTNQISIVDQQMIKMAADQKQKHYRNSMNNDFITCEDQVDSIENTNQKFVMSSTHHTPRVMASSFQKQEQQPIDFSQENGAKLAKTQRMDLPNMMSEEQASFMMHKVYRNQYLEQVDQYNRKMKKRGHYSRLCSTQRFNSVQQASQDLKIEANSDSRTNIQYSGNVVTEPKFQKTKARYFKQNESLQMQVPVLKSNFIMQLNRDPRTPYSQARFKNLNEKTLQANDETYALIDSHVERMKVKQDDKKQLKQLQEQQQSQYRKVIKNNYSSSQKGKTAKNSQSKIGELIQPQSANTSLQSYGHQNKNIFTQVQSPTSRKTIQILKLEKNSQGTSGQYFETGGGSSNNIDGLRMSTKMLGESQKDKNQAAIPNPIILNTNTMCQVTEVNFTDPSPQPPQLQSNHHLINFSPANEANTTVMQPMSPQLSKGNLEMESGSFYVKVKRQPLSPQPMDTHSKLLVKDGVRSDDQMQSGFISIKQDYAIPSTQGHETMPLAYENQLVESGQVDQTVVMSDIQQHVLTNLTIQPRKKIALSNPRKRFSNTFMQSSCQSNIIEMSQEHINPVPTIFKDGSTSNRHYQKKELRKHGQSYASSKNKLQKKASKEQSFKVSGIKMFNHPEVATKSGLISNDNSISARNQILKSSSKDMANLDIDVNQQFGVFRKSLEPESQTNLVNRQEDMQIVNENLPFAVKTEVVQPLDLSPVVKDSYDGVSTENKSKSPSLVHQTKLTNQTRKLNIGDRANTLAQLQLTPTETETDLQIEQKRTLAATSLNK